MSDRGRYYIYQGDRYDDDSKDSYKPFAETLDSLMDEHGLTGDMLATEIGISKPAISSYLSAKSFPKIEVLKNLKEYFGVSYDYLLGATDVRTPDPSVQSAMELLGLSEYALWYIQTMLQPEKEILDSILCSEQGRNMLVRCMEAKLKFDSVRSEIKSFDSDSATAVDWYAAMYKTTELENTVDLWKLRLSKSFEAMIDDVLGADKLSSDLREYFAQLHSDKPKPGK